MKNYHLAILKRPYLEAILDGRKKIESRLTKTRRSPIGQVLPGDKIFFKISSGPVCATATVKKVKTFYDLTSKQITKIKEQYNHQIGGSCEYWQGRTDCKFCFLLWLEDIKRIEPIKINKKDFRAWVILTKKENFGLLKI